MRGGDPRRRAGLFRSVGFRFVVAQRLPRKPQAGDGSLPWPTILVPIVVFSVLCIFLFPFFSGSGEVCCRPPSIRLPVSRLPSDTEWITPGPVITVERGVVTVDAQPAFLNPEAAGRQDLAALGGLLDQRMETYRRLHPGRPRSRHVVLAADRETSYAVLNPILRLCFERGLTVQLAVQREAFGRI